MKKEELWLKYSKTKDKEIKKQLIEEYIYLVKIVAGRMYNFFGTKIEYDDLIGFGAIGLIDSIERFDINKNIRFETYAQIRIRGTIIDNVRKLDWIPRSLRQKSKQVQEAIGELENKLGRTPTTKELVKHLDMPLEEVESMLNHISNFNKMSLEDLLINKKEYSIDGDNWENLPDRVYEENELKVILANIIDNLPDNEKKVISLYYYEELTYKEIGYIMELSESRISQIHSRAISNIKKQLNKKGILEA